MTHGLFDSLFLTTDPKLNISGLYIAVGFIGFPFLLLSMFMFTQLMKEIGVFNINKPVRMLRTIVIAVFFITNTTLLSLLFYHPTPILRHIFFYFDLLIYFTPFFLSLTAVCKISRLTDLKKQKFWKSFNLIFSGGYLIYFLTELSYIFHLHDIDISPFLHFSVNILPLLYLQSKISSTNPLHNSPGTIRDRQIAGYEFSERESEVLRLLLSGKSREEIGEILFISKHTVKNHTYNIYKKLKIKNKSQLFHLFQP